MNLKFLYILFFISLILLSCKKDESPIIYQVPVSVESLVHSFNTEAENRGHFFDINNLIVELSDDPILNSGVYSCGIATGEITGQFQNIIQIDTQCLAWRHGDLAREILIYHELSHVFLERLHTDDLLPNGDWKSMMTGQNWQITDFYINDLGKREYYIEELFDPSTEIPDWAK